MTRESDTWSPASGSETWGGEPKSDRAPEAPALGISPEQSGRYRGVDPGGQPTDAPPYVIGRGGLGEVLAVWDEQLKREVALKSLTVRGPGSTGTSHKTAAGARFLREARITARLQHPNIVPVHEIGARDDGRLYYTMRYVRGGTLADALAACKTPRERLRWMDAYARVCHAIAYAHSQGVVHRDLKPANVMVGAFGETVVLDWGLAKALGDVDPAGDGPVGESREPHGADPADRTLQGAIMGTPAYMPPEQANGERDAIDARSDVWALGAMLYELLTGSAVYRGPNARAVLALAQAGRPPRAQGHPDIPTELAAVIDKALAVRPADRYENAGALVADVDAWRQGGFVGAHRYSPLDWLRWAIRQNPLAAAVGTASVLLLTLLGTASAIQLRAERNSAVQALADALVARAASAWADRDPLAADLYAAGALTRRDAPAVRGWVLQTDSGLRPTLGWRTPLDHSCARLAVNTHGTLCVSRKRVSFLHPTGAVAWSADVPGEALLAAATDPHLAVLLEDGRALRWRPDGALPATAQPSTDAPVAVAGARDRLVWATGGDTPALWMWFDADASPRRVATLDAPIADIWLEGDQAWLLYGRGTIEELSLVTGQRRPVMRLPGPRYALARTSEGDWITTGIDGSLQRHAPDGTLRLETTDRGGPGQALLSPDGRWLVDVREDGGLRVVVTQTGQTVSRLPMPAQSWRSLAFTATGDLLVGESDGVRSWRIPTADAAPDPEGLWSGRLPDGAWTRTLLPHPDGRTLVTRTPSGLLGWEVASGHAIGRIGPDTFAAFSPGGGWLALASAEGGWELVQWANGVRHHRTGPPVQRLRWVDDAHLLLLTRDGVLSLTDLDGTPIRQLEGLQLDNMWSAADRVLVGAGHRYWTWTPATGALLAQPDTDARDFALSPDGRRWVRAEGSSLVIGSLTTGQDIAHHPLAETAMRIAWSHDGRTLAVGLANRTIALLDAQTGQTVAELVGHRNRIQALEFSQDDRVLYSASWDATTKAWRLDRLHRPADAILAEAEAAAGARLDGAEIRP